MHTFSNYYFKNIFFIVIYLGAIFLTAQPLEAKRFECQCAKDKKRHLERTYITFNYPSTATGGQTLLTGIRKVKNRQDQVYITGFYNDPNGITVIPFVYKGTFSGKGSWNILNYPSFPGSTVNLTNLYGPNNGPKSTIQVVGNYTLVETGSKSFGCLYQGALDGSGQWSTLTPPAQEPILNTIVHSTMGGLAVGNFSTQDKISRAFIYDIKSDKYFEIVKNGAVDITSYGIWYDGCNDYTICGGFSDLHASSGLSSAYLVRWNAKTKKLSNWRTYSYKNDPITSFITHFDGITSDGKGGYNLTGDWSGVSQVIPQGFYCHIKKNAKNNQATWSPISFPGRTITSGNSIYKNVVIGSYVLEDDLSVNGYLAIPLGHL